MKQFIQFGFVVALAAVPAVQAATLTTPGPVYITIQEVQTGVAGADIITGSINAPGGPGGIAGTYTPANAATPYTGFDPSATVSFSNEIPGVGGSTGSFDAHFEYLTSYAIAPGVVFAENFNIFGPGGELSDTLGITFTGHQPGGGDNNNVSIDLHYRSDNETILLSQLANGIAVNEPSSGFLDISQMIAANSPGAAKLIDFNLQFQSDTPEPASAGLAMLALGGMFFARAKARRSAQR